MLDERLNLRRRGDPLMKVSFESKGDFDNLSKWLDSIQKNNPKTALSRIGEKGIKQLADNTPRDTGETANGWTTRVTTKNNVSEIAWINTSHPNLSVNLAKLLDQGYTNGTGGFIAPRPYIIKSMDSVWDEAGDIIFKELVK